MLAVVRGLGYKAHTHPQALAAVLVYQGGPGEWTLPLAHTAVVAAKLQCVPYICRGSPCKTARTQE